MNTLKGLLVVVGLTLTFFLPASLVGPLVVGYLIFVLIA